MEAAKGRSGGGREIENVFMVYYSCWLYQCTMQSKSLDYKNVSYIIINMVHYRITPSKVIRNNTEIIKKRTMQN